MLKHFLNQLIRPMVPEDPDVSGDVQPLAPIAIPDFEAFAAVRRNDALKALFDKGDDETTRDKALSPAKVYVQALMDELTIKTLDGPGGSAGLIHARSHHVSRLVSVPLSRRKTQSVVLHRA